MYLLQHCCCNSFAFHVAAKVCSWIDCARWWAAVKADATLERRVALSGKWVCDAIAGPTEPNADMVTPTTDRRPSHLDLGHLNVNSNFNSRAKQLSHESFQFGVRVAPCLFHNVKVPCEHTRVVTSFTLLYERFIRCMRWVEDVQWRYPPVTPRTVLGTDES